MIKSHIDKYTFLLFLLCLTACIKEIELPDFKPEEFIVINALLRNNDSGKVYIETTKSFNVKTNVDVLDTLIVFSISNNTDTTYFDYVDGCYLANDSFMSNSKVDIYILGDVFKDFYNLKIPQKPKISSAEQTACRKFDTYGDPITEVKFIIEDEKSEEDFYLFYIYQQENLNHPWKIGYYNYYEVNDPVLINEGILDYAPDFFILSDDLFNGENYEVRLELVIGTSTYSSTVPAENYLVVQKITEDYYLFLKSWLKHKHNQNTGEHTDFLVYDPFVLLFQGEPVNLFSNSSTGYGIIAGYSEKTIKLKYEPDL